MTKGNGRSATSRALDLLGAFTIEHPTLTLTELATRCAMPLATAHRLVAALEAWGALERNTDNRYQIGTRLWEIGLLSPVPRRMREIALPFMQDLYEKSKENIHFAVRDGHETLYIAKLTGHQAVPIISREGNRLPMHSTGVGKALLAFSSKEFIDTYCARPLARYTRHTIVEPGRLRRELAVTRERGYSLTNEEMTLGSCSVAVPVFDARGEIAASLGVVVHSVRDNLTKYVPDLKAEAAKIAKMMIAHHCDPYPGFVHDLPQGV
ncbi:DNA-binding IclR family transcriptional regulator [Saccharothrix tamanrassetensis]|uniref:DNA-binding IclR family transcriptional regulator n=1 Tax=Saccharothrix tamanrassetensis TaxID=1051531 RepID=A0A841CAS2_9PSEU|nr:IclR family transcriptional regulator [Saccharothrix tamanrassetensis]MBB5954301.1 DNA-binding IclR family transcriptional regulator [Saccharothrix tamanrassetensis]